VNKLLTYTYNGDIVYSKFNILNCWSGDNGNNAFTESL